MPAVESTKKIMRLRAYSSELDPLRRSTTVDASALAGAES